MATKWDPLVLKYQRRSQQELAAVANLRRLLSETEQNREKVMERQQHLRAQLTVQNSCDIGDWRVLKTFLADLDTLRNQCEGRIFELKDTIRLALLEHAKTDALVQKYEHLQKQNLEKVRRDRERIETDALDEWAVQSHSRAVLARDLHNPT
jgi:flagellar biosynthesis chaperone FliJ